MLEGTLLTPVTEWPLISLNIMVVLWCYRGTLSLNILGPHNSLFWKFSCASGPCPLGVRSTKPVQVQKAEKNQRCFGISESESKVAQSCTTLCDPMDCSLPGSSVHEFSRQEYRGSSRPRDRTGSQALQADSLSSEPPGNPILGLARNKNSQVVQW